MVLVEDKEMNRIYGHKYPNQIIFPCAILRYEEQCVNIHLSSAILCEDKYGHSDHNVKLEADIHKLSTNIGLIKGGRYSLIFPKISFYVMMAQAGIVLKNNNSSYKITFKKKNDKSYVILKNELVPQGYSEEVIR